MRKTLRIFLWVLGITVTAHGLAAEQDPVIGASNGADDGIAEIIVTAQKRSENLEIVPVAVTAFTSKERDLIGIETLQDFTDFTPGLAYSTVLDRAFIRGVGRETNNLGTEPGVATYLDGVYNFSTVAAAGGSLFIDRTEVLRGPQGTLYGRNAIGGTIDAFSRRPTKDWYAEVRTNIANYGTYNFAGALSGPISDSMRFRIAGYRNTQEKGFFNNLAEPGETEGNRGGSFYIEGQLEWDITQDIEFWLKFSQYGYNNSYYRAYNTLGSYDYAQYPPGSLSPGAAYGFTQPGYVALGGAQCALNPANANIRNFCTNTPTGSHLSRTYSVTPQLTWTTPYGVDVKYVGGYTSYYYDLHYDDDNTSVQSYTFPVTPGSSGCGAGIDCPGTLITPVSELHYIENSKYYSNELNLTSHNDSNFQWIAGLYQYADHVDQPTNIPIHGQTQLAMPTSLTALTTALNPSNSIYFAGYTLHQNSYATFAQTDWKFLPTWKFTTGVRYNYDEENGSEAARLLYFHPDTTYGVYYVPVYDITGLPTVISFAPAPGVKSPPYLLPGGNYVRELGATWHAITGTAGIEWTPRDSLLAYLKYSRGYKAGGLNAGPIVALPESNPEYLDAYETGIKWSEKTFQINEALFFYNYKGKQIPLTVLPAGGGPSYAAFFNIPKILSYGAETEAIWQPLSALQLRLDYSYMEAFIDAPFKATDATAQTAFAAGAPGFTADRVTPQLDGSTVPFAPRHKVAANANYTFKFAPGSLNFSTSYVWKIHTYSSIFNEPYNLAPSYSTVDLRTTWNDVNNRYTVFLYCHNLTNKVGYEGVGSGGISTPAPGYGYTTQTPSLIPPRQYGIELQYRLK